MINKNTIKENITIPNILSLIRIIIILPFVNYFLEKDYLTSAILLALSGLSDMFDGMIARKFNQISPLGAILDPIADKLTLIAIVICLLMQFPVLLPIVILMLSKELAMLICGGNLIRKGITPPSSNWYGKVSTILFYTSAVIIVSLEAIWGYQNNILAFVLMTITTLSMIYTLVRYAQIYFKLLKEHDKKNN